MLIHNQAYFIIARLSLTMVNPIRTRPIFSSLSLKHSQYPSRWCPPQFPHIVSYLHLPGRLTKIYPFPQVTPNSKGTILIEALFFGAMTTHAPYIHFCSTTYVPLIN